MSRYSRFFKSAAHSMRGGLVAAICRGRAFERRCRGVAGAAGSDGPGKRWPPNIFNTARTSRRLKQRQSTVLQRRARRISVWPPMNQQRCLPDGWPMPPLSPPTPQNLRTPSKRKSKAESATANAALRAKMRLRPYGGRPVIFTQSEWRKNRR